MGVMTFLVTASLSADEYADGYRDGYKAASDLYDRLSDLRKRLADLGVEEPSEVDPEEAEGWFDVGYDLGLKVGAKQLEDASRTLTTAGMAAGIAMTRQLLVAVLGQMSVDADGVLRAMAELEAEALERTSEEAMVEGLSILLDGLTRADDDLPF